MSNNVSSSPGLIHDVIADGEEISGGLLTTYCKIVAEAIACIAESDPEEDGDDGNWRGVEIAARKIALQPAKDFRDVRAKAILWLALAPEDALDVDVQTADEALLASIMADIDRLVEQ